MNALTRKRRRLSGWLVALALLLPGMARAQAETPLDDPHRPVFHFTASKGWINDPNGLFFFQGQWHLGYQALWPRHWGHAVSEDLLRWRELPLMLTPDARGDMWSGSAAVDWKNASKLFKKAPGVVAAFTYWGPPDPKVKTQSVGLALSDDGGQSWRKFDGNPVLFDPSLKNFRDPKIFWHQPTARGLRSLRLATPCASIDRPIL